MDFAIEQQVLRRVRGKQIKVWLQDGGKLADIPEIILALNKKVPENKILQFTIMITIDQIVDGTTEKLPPIEVNDL